MSKSSKKSKIEALKSWVKTVTIPKSKFRVIQEDFEKFKKEKW